MTKPQMPEIHMVHSKVTVFVEKPFNFPRLSSGFAELRPVLLETIRVSRGRAFTARHCETALERMVSRGRYTLQRTPGESMAGRSREFVKLWRWLGITTNTNTKEPLEYSLTRRGKSFLEEKDDEKLRQICRDIMLSWKIYSHLWKQAEEEIERHSIRPSFILADTIFATRCTCRATDIFLTVMRLSQENLLACRTLLIQLRSEKNLAYALLSAIRPTRMRNVMSDIQNIISSSKSLSDFSKRTRRKVGDESESGEWGWNKFKRGRIGFELVRRYFDQEETLDDVVDQIYVLNNTENARRSVGPFVKLLIQSDILQKVGKDEYAISGSMSVRALDLLRRPTIWLEDLERESLDVIWAGYSIELLNLLHDKVGGPITIDARQLASHLLETERARRITSYSPEAVLLGKTFDMQHIRTLLGLLVSLGIATRIAESQVRIPRLIDFDIEYDVPRERLDHNDLQRILRDVLLDVEGYAKPIPVEDFYYVGFDERLCYECLTKFRGFARLPCVQGCASEFGESRINVLSLDRRKEVRMPIACMGCMKCFAMQPTLPVIMERRAAMSAGVCPVPTALTIDLKSSRVKINEEDCMRCGLCSAACPFGAIILDDSMTPRVCNPVECKHSCAVQCRSIGLGGIRLHPRPPEDNYVEWFAREISEKASPVRTFPSQVKA